MYIQNMFKQVNHSKVAKEYRDELKSMCKLNLRRNSKFNLMSIWGALKTLKEEFQIRHRDLKPQNILKRYDRYYLGDFTTCKI